MKKLILILALVISSVISTYAQTTEIVREINLYEWNTRTRSYDQIKKVTDVKVPIVYEDKKITIYTDKNNPHVINTFGESTITTTKGGVTTYTWDAYDHLIENWIKFGMTTDFKSKFSTISVRYTDGDKSILAMYSIY